MPQGVLPYEYQASPSASGLTSLAGLGLVLDLVTVLDLADALDSEVGLRQHPAGWTDAQLVLSLMLLNLAGGDCVDDLERLEADEGFTRLLRRVEDRHLPRWKRRERETRWRKGGRPRAIPSPSAMRRYLRQFRNPEEEALIQQGRAYVPEPSSALVALRKVAARLLAHAQRVSPEKVATLDLDATLVPTTKREALYAYKDGKAYQPLQAWWVEQELLVHTEFRDGNVGAGHRNLEVFLEALEALPAGVKTVRLRADTASYQSRFLRYLEEAKHPRFGRIEFAVGADVTPEFRSVVAQLCEDDWKPVYEYPEGPGEDPRPTGREVAELVYVPGDYALTKQGEYRFLAVRRLRDQPRLPGTDSGNRPFQTYQSGQLQYELRGMITNLRNEDGWDAEDVVHFLDLRMGRSERVHDELKNDLAGGTLPSKYFGVNAAWWQITALAHNLGQLLRRFALGSKWAHRRMKALRFHVLGLAGRVVESGRRLRILLSEKASGAVELLVAARRRILELARPPPDAEAP